MTTHRPPGCGVSRPATGSRPVTRRRGAATTIAAADQEPAPLRVVLGSDSFQFVRQGLTSRLASTAHQDDSAALADVG